jgi:hypothetical protein
MKGVVALLGLFVVTPIWFYLLHSILIAIHADRLLWFLFWVYLPVGFLMAAMEKLIKLAEAGK